MKRRRLFRILGAGLTTAVAGCAGAADTTPTITATPTPAESELEINVENRSNKMQTVTFTLTMMAGNIQKVEGFELSEIEPGDTRTHGPSSLDPGRYHLQIDLLSGMSSTIEWVGHRCPRKQVTIKIRADGFELRDDCPAA